MVDMMIMMFMGLQMSHLTMPSAVFLVRMVNNSPNLDTEYNTEDTKRQDVPSLLLVCDVDIRLHHSFVGRSYPLCMLPNSSLLLSFHYFPLSSPYHFSVRNCPACFSLVQMLAGLVSLLLKKCYNLFQLLLCDHSSSQLTE